ncbi:hypothetical protein [Curtobacterium sp. MCLR17_055]|uniref:hypothetical protein n=1 Tax=Curtobacterium sp. MCLR17_055 TaxID=2175633 RepID=UPI0021ABECF1|nr:hypothetical protein [Curtobacterium sp. MCLR17_055]
MTACIPEPRTPHPRGTGTTHDVEGGPGWRIRSADLRPVITDLAAFRAGLADDPLREEIELLWTGKAGDALRRLERVTSTQRVRALRADCHRDLGHTRAAVREYDLLVAECIGTTREATMRQHRGKALLAAGNVDRAVEDFTFAVALRQASDPVLLASAEQALAVARSRVGDGTAEVLTGSDEVDARPPVA